MHICATLQVYINSQGILNKEEKNMSKKTGLIAMVISVVSLICSIASIANMMQMKAAQAVPALEAVQETASVETPLDTASMEAAPDTGSVAATPDAEAEDTQAHTRDTAAQYVMYVGTNDKDTYKPEHTNEEAMNIVDQICLKYFDGYTLQDATGSWTDETGTPTHEYTLVCYFDAADVATVYAAADEIIKELNQNTVLIEKTEIEMEYYSGAK